MGWVVTLHVVAALLLASQAAWSLDSTDHGRVSMVELFRQGGAGSESYVSADVQVQLPAPLGGRTRTLRHMVLVDDDFRNPVTLNCEGGSWKRTNIDGSETDKVAWTGRVTYMSPIRQYSNAVILYVEGNQTEQSSIIVPQSLILKVTWHQPPPPSK